MATRAERRQATQNRVKAMTHQLRAEAFRLIRDKGPVSPKEVAQHLEVAVKDLNYHIRKLEEYGCIEEVSTRKVRAVLEHFYVATEQHMIDTDEWDELVENEPEMAEFIVDDVIQSILDDYTTSRRVGIVAKDQEFFIARTPHIFDSEGIHEALAASQAYEDAMTEIAVRSASRRSKEETDDLPVCTSIAFFKMPKSSTLRSS
ncbi:MAG: helix-turn-helix domain-containing protein [Actinomycetota bacterium]|nr:helix-turn-helix domain-containing protein [Actinomycetota bacterium]